jgi:hypothetical protein
MRDKVSAVKVLWETGFPRFWLKVFNGWHGASVFAEVQKISMRDGVSAVYIV